LRSSRLLGRGTWFFRGVERYNGVREMMRKGRHGSKNGFGLLGEPLVEAKLLVFLGKEKGQKCV